MAPKPGARVYIEGFCDQYTFLVAARILATYLIPGCVGRGVSLGSESGPLGPSLGPSLGHLRPKPGPKPGPSRAQAGPKPDFWNFGNLEPGNLGIWDPKKSRKYKFSKSKSVLPKMSARSGLVGKNPPGPIWGHLRQFFPWTEQI